MRMAGVDDGTLGVGGIGGDEGAGVARYAGVELAVRGGHGEFRDSALGDGGVRGHFGGSGVGGSEDEVAVFVGGREGCVGEFGGADVAWGVGVAGGWSRTGLLGVGEDRGNEGEERSELKC
jgi:hypothetical protein